MASGLLIVWGATSLQDASVYIADAPFRALELIGGTHDWWFLLGQWEKLDWADEIARMVWMVGLTLGLCGLVLIVTRPARAAWDWLGNDGERDSAIPIGAVREARGVR